MTTISLLEISRFHQPQSSSASLHKIDELMTRCDALENLRAERDAKLLAVHTTAVRQLLNVADTDGHIQARDFLGQHFGELYTVTRSSKHFLMISCRNSPSL